MTGLPQKLAANLSAIVLLIVGAAFAGDGPTVHEPPEWRIRSTAVVRPSHYPTTGCSMFPEAALLVLFGL